MKTQLLKYNLNDGWDKTFEIEDSEQTLIIVFGASAYLNHLKPFNELNTAYPQAKIIGCSTAGEILENKIYDEHLVVSITRFEKTTIAIKTVVIAEMSASKQVGETLSKAFNQTGLKSIFVLSDGLGVNGTALINGINANTDKNVIVTGGLAGDGDKFQQTWVLKDGIPQIACVSAIAFYGNNFSISHGSKGGWKPFGSKRKITKSDNNVLYELDGEPALDLYKDYLGKLANGLPATGLRFPILINKDNEEKFLVRTILAVDETTKSMTFAGDVPEGYVAQLMSANFDQLVDGAEQAAKTSITDNTSPDLIVAISCVGRRMVLGEESEAEVEAVQESFSKKVAQIGFYSYGELSPYISGDSDLHNQTMTITSFSET